MKIDYYVLMKNKKDNKASEEQASYNRVPTQTFFKKDILPGINMIVLYLNWWLIGVNMKFDLDEWHKGVNQLINSN